MFNAIIGVILFFGLFFVGSIIGLVQTA